MIRVRLRIDARALPTMRTWAIPLTAFLLMGSLTTGILSSSLGTSPPAPRPDLSHGSLLSVRTMTETTTVNPASSATLPPISGTEEAEINTGAGPRSIALASDQGELFVADSASSAVTIVSDQTDGVVATFPVCTDPVAVAYDPVGGRLFVACGGSTHVQVINLQTERVLANLTMPFHPNAFAVDNATGTVFVVGNYYGYETIGPTNLTLYPHVANVCGGESLAVYDPVDGNVYVGGGCGLARFSASDGGAAVATRFYDSLSALAFDPVSDQLLLGNSGNCSIAAYDPGSGAIGSWVQMNGAAPSALGLDTTTGELYATLALANELMVLNGTNLAPLGTLGLGADPLALVVDPDNGVVYAADEGSKSLTAIATAPLNLSIAVSTTTVDVGLPASFTASPSGGLPPFDDFAWSFSDGSSAVTGTGEVNHTFEFPGAMQPTVTLTDGGQRTASAQLSLGVGPYLPAINASASVVDVGQPVLLTANVSFGAPPFGPFVWSGLPEDCAGATTSWVLCEWSGSGNYSVSATTTDSMGVSSGPGPRAVITVYADPFVGFPVANRSSVDVGQSISFSAPASLGEGAYSFVWSGLPEGCVPEGATANCTVTDAGALMVSVEVQDGNGERSTPSPATVVPVYAEPSVTLVPEPDVVDVSGLLALTAHVSGGAGDDFYDWYGLPRGCPTNGPLILCAPSFSDVGTYVATVSVVDANLARATSPPVVLSVGPVLTLENPQFSGSEIAGAPISFSETSVGGTGTVAFNWSFGDGTYSDGARVTHTYAVAGNYTIDVRGVDGGGSDRSLQFTLAVNPAVAALGPAHAPGGGGGFGNWLSAGSFLIGVTAGVLGAFVIGRASDALFVGFARHAALPRPARPRRIRPPAPPEDEPPGELPVD